MEKINVKNNEISFKSVLEGRYHDTEKGWVDMGELSRQNLAREFKNFLLSHCRNGSKVYRNIERLSILDCENYGIFERLLYNFEYNKVHYIAGQSYSDEIATLKKLVLK